MFYRNRKIITIDWRFMVGFRNRFCLIPAKMYYKDSQNAELGFIVTTIVRYTNTKEFLEILVNKCWNPRGIFYLPSFFIAKRPGWTQALNKLRMFVNFFILERWLHTRERKCSVKRAKRRSEFVLFTPFYFLFLETTH